MGAFDGYRVLIVEDEAIVAAMLEDMVVGMGAIVVGPAYNLAQAMALAERETIELAILDVNIRGDSIENFADMLRGTQIPLVFSTGYGGGAAAITRDAPVIDKPCTEERLASGMALALGMSARAPSDHPGMRQPEL